MSGLGGSPRLTVRSPRRLCPVGTQATVRHSILATLQPELGAELILSNTYHPLYFRPGAICGGPGWAACTGSWAGRPDPDRRRVAFQVFSLAGAAPFPRGVLFPFAHRRLTARCSPQRWVIRVSRSSWVSGHHYVAWTSAPSPTTGPTQRACPGPHHTWAGPLSGGPTPRPRPGLFGIVQGGIWADLKAGRAPSTSQCPRFSRLCYRWVECRRVQGARCYAMLDVTAPCCRPEAALSMVWAA